MRVIYGGYFTAEWRKEVIMKRVLALLLVLCMSFAFLAGCGQKNSDDAGNTPDSGENMENGNTEAKKDDVTIRIGGLKGPTSIGLVKLMEDDEAGAAKNDYDFTVAGSADELTPKLVQGELDIAAVPSNLASVLYNNTEGAVQLLAINTLGVVYIAAKGVEITSVEQLRGQTIYATGKGSTPEYALRYVLQENGIDPDSDVTIEWKSEPTEVVAILSESESGVAMLPQPYVTVAQTQVEGLNIALDLTEEWDKVSDGSMLITGTLVVRKEFAQEHPEALREFLEEYEASTEYANSNVADAAQLVEKFDLFKAAVAEKAIPYCNITFIAGEDMKEPMEGYLNVVYGQAEAAVGGKLPGDDFYYVQ